MHIIFVGIILRYKLISGAFMNENLGEKQIAIKLSDNYISRLDDLAKRGHTNRRQLMLNFIKIWLNELKEINKVNYLENYGENGGRSTYRFLCKRYCRE